MHLQLNELAPNFNADTTHGEINFHEWIGDGWAVLFSHPKDFTPISTTEMGALAKLEPEFQKRKVKIIGLSIDSVADHHQWLNDIVDVCGKKPAFPIIADMNLEVAKLYNMLPKTLQGTAQGRTAGDNQTVRTVFLVGPDKKLKPYFRVTPDPSVV